MVKFIIKDKRNNTFWKKGKYHHQNKWADNKEDATIYNSISGCKSAMNPFCYRRNEAGRFEKVTKFPEWAEIIEVNFTFGDSNNG